MLLGVISDTHGLLRPQAIDALAGVEHILHAGDVGNPDILDRLRQLAPVTAIRGNVDIHGPCAELPQTEAVELAGHFLYMVHALEDLDLNPRAAGISVVIYGHSHKPSALRRDGVLYLNPGSAGPRRFSLPVTLSLLRLEADSAIPELIELAV
jgi:putative phosphoesterase